MWRSGTLIELSASFGFTLRLVVNCVSEDGNVITLARPEEPYAWLSISDQTLAVTYSNTSNKKQSTFLAIRTEKSIQIKCFAYAKKASMAIYLGANADMQLTAAPLDALHTKEFILKFPQTTVKSITLYSWQQHRFVLEGYVQVPRVVDAEQIDGCLRVINTALGTVGALHAGGTQVGKGKLGGGLSNHPVLVDLARTTALPVMEALLGVGNVDLQSVSAQIALRFPQERSEGVDEWHTDGLRQGRWHNFSLLVGVCLSDVEADEGPLLVWPGSHLLLHMATASDVGDVNVALLASLVQHNKGMFRDVEPGASLGAPLAVRARRGDVLLLHPDLAHAGGPNYSSSIRYMVYFRIRTLQWSHACSAFAEDMWVDLPGVRDTALALKAYTASLLHVDADSDKLI